MFIKYWFLKILETSGPLIGLVHLAINFIRLSLASTKQLQPAGKLGTLHRAGV
jgi:hypothetical protein